MDLTILCENDHEIHVKLLMFSIICYVFVSLSAFYAK